MATYAITLPADVQAAVNAAHNALCPSGIREMHPADRMGAWAAIDKQVQASPNLRALKALWVASVKDIKPGASDGYQSDMIVDALQLLTEGTQDSPFLVTHTAGYPASTLITWAMLGDARHVKYHVDLVNYMGYELHTLVCGGKTAAITHFEALALARNGQSYVMELCAGNSLPTLR